MGSQRNGGLPGREGGRKAAGETEGWKKEDVLAAHGVGNGFCEGTKSRFLLTD